MVTCVFKDVLCIDNRDRHDKCRKCNHVPVMNGIHPEIEMRVLCAVAGQREKKKEEYGSRSRKPPIWYGQLEEQMNGIVSIPCTDHRRYVTGMIINEPYSVDMNQMRDLIAFCDEHGLYFYVDGDSSHFPGRCFRIIISKKQR